MDTYQTQVNNADEQNTQALSDWLNSDKDLSHDELDDLIDLSSRPEMRNAIVENFDKIEKQKNFEPNLGKHLASNLKDVKTDKRTDKMNNIISTYGKQSVRDRFTFVEKPQQDKPKRGLKNRIRSFYNRGKEKVMNAANRIKNLVRDKVVNMTLGPVSAMDVLDERVGKHADRVKQRINNMRPSVMKQNIHNYYDNLKLDYQSKKVARKNEIAVDRAVKNHPDRIINTLNENPTALQNPMIFRAVQKQAKNILAMDGLKPEVVEQFKQLNENDRNPHFAERRELAQYALEDLAEKQQKQHPITAEKSEQEKPVERKQSTKDQKLNQQVIDMINNDPQALIDSFNKNPKLIQNESIRHTVAQNADKFFQNDAKHLGYKPETLGNMLIANDNNQHTVSYSGDQLAIYKGIQQSYAHELLNSDNAQAYHKSMQQAFNVINSVPEVQAQKAEPEQQTVYEAPVPEMQKAEPEQQTVYEAPVYTVQNAKHAKKDRKVYEVPKEAQVTKSYLSEPDEKPGQRDFERINNLRVTNKQDLAEKTAQKANKQDQNMASLEDNIPPETANDFTAGLNDLSDPTEAELNEIIDSNDFDNGLNDLSDEHNRSHENMVSPAL